MWTSHLSKEKVTGYRERNVRLLWHCDYWDVRLLWHLDYWDGPLSGMCEVNGKRLWFTFFDEKHVEIPNVDENLSETLSVRIYHLVELTAEQMAWQRKWHGEFRKHVGMHTDYGKEHGRGLHEVRPESEWYKFLVPYHADTEEHVIESSQAVAWCMGDDFVYITNKAL